MSNKRIKSKFLEIAGDFLRQTFSSKAYQQIDRNNKFILRNCSVVFEPDDILEVMYDQIEELRRFLPYAEEVYQQLEDLSKSRK